MNLRQQINLEAIIDDNNGGRINNCNGWNKILVNGHEKFTNDGVQIIGLITHKISSFNLLLRLIVLVQP